jgi:glycogen operon protein
MSPQDWNESFARAVTIALSGVTGDPEHPDDPFLILVNAWWEPLDFSVPTPLRDRRWRVEIDTADPAALGGFVDPSSPVTLTGRALVLLRAGVD